MKGVLSRVLFIHVKSKTKSNSIAELNSKSAWSGPDLDANANNAHKNARKVRNVCIDIKVFFQDGQSFGVVIVVPAHM